MGAGVCGDCGCDCRAPWGLCRKQGCSLGRELGANRAARDAGLPCRARDEDAVVQDVWSAWPVEGLVECTTRADRHNLQGSKGRRVRRPERLDAGRRTHRTHRTVRTACTLCRPADPQAHARIPPAYSVAVGRSLSIRLDRLLPSLHTPAITCSQDCDSTRARRPPRACPSSSSVPQSLLPILPPAARLHALAPADDPPDQRHYPYPHGLAALTRRPVSPHSTSNSRCKPPAARGLLSPARSIVSTTCACSPPSLPPRTTHASLGHFTTCAIGDVELNPSRLDPSRHF